MDIKKKYQSASYENDLEENSLQDTHNTKNRLKSKKVMLVFGCITFVVIALIVGFIVRYELKRPSLEKMMLYMEEKYGEEFEVLAVNTQTWMDDYTDIEVRSAKFPDEYITVRTYLEDGKRVYEDSYIEILKREEFNAAFQKVVSEVYGECKVYVTSVEAMTTLPPEINMNTSIEDILSNYKILSMINIYIEGDEAKKKQQLQNLISKLKQKNWNANIDIYYLDKGFLNKLDLYNQISDKNNEINYYLYGSIVLSRNFEITYEEWREY